MSPGANVDVQEKICASVLDKIFSSHVVDNAFLKLKFGNRNVSGIFGATPTDLMHAFEEGVVPYFMEVVVDPMPESQKKILDNIIADLFTENNNRGTGRTNYP